MEDYRISKNWLIIKLDPDDPQWAMAVEQLCPDFDQGDEFCHYDEPAPPGINAERWGLPWVDMASRFARQSPPRIAVGIHTF
jgi:hypothetical protein